MSELWEVQAVERDPETGEITSRGRSKEVPPEKVIKDLEKQPGCWVVIKKGITVPKHGPFVYGATEKDVRAGGLIPVRKSQLEPGIRVPK